MTAPHPRLDTATVPLDGMLSVEASAGTGKTYALEELYLRLLLERDLDVASILVVTYTKAATAELRMRIRRRIDQTLEAFRVGASDDPFVAALLTSHRDREAAGDVLRRALRGFDEAAIFTIHGFCQRVLEERAFESGVAFEAELVPDESALLLEIVDDFWRRTTWAATRPLVRALLAARWSPEMLAKELRTELGRSYAHVEAPAMPADLPKRAATLEAALAAVRRAWPAARDAVEACLRRPGLHRGSYRPARVDAILIALDMLAGSVDPAGALRDRLACVTTSKLREKTNRGFVPPAHPFFDLAETAVAAWTALDAGHATAMSALRARLLSEAKDELARRKAERHERSYDDLLSAVAHALGDELRGVRLAEAIRARWRAALVDEFQDTDPEQYRIVRHVYGGTDLPVVLVGDPKQAIYSFRGADVFSYLAATRDAARHARLDRNHRADAPLVAGVNALFSARDRAFVLDGIDFQPTEPAKDAAERGLAVPGDGDAALRVWWMGPSDATTTKLGVADARGLAAEATAAEIVRLLRLGRSGAARCGDHDLRGSDIAVLVRRNEDGRTMREVLLAHGVASVQEAIDSIFASREARELERVLVAVLQPGRAALVRGALATEMLGGTNADLQSLEGDESAWDERILAFHDYHQRWRRDGFSAMLHEMLGREAIATRLLAFPDGERRLTNLFHLRELLQAASGRHGGGLDALVEWLADERAGVVDPEIGEDEHLLRLESDAELVRIVTVHKAKGLQYPVVFCPFLWEGRLFADSASSVVYHEGDVATLAIDPEKKGVVRARAGAEELAERLRLAYVALTRAKHRCYVVWGPIAGGGTSPLGWLLHGAGEPDLGALTRRYNTAEAATLRAEVEALAGSTNGALALETAPAATRERVEPIRVDPASLAPRGVRRRVGPGYTIASFSAFLRHAGEAERPRHDPGELAPPSPVDGRPTDRHGFPAGVRPGLCLHEILERFDFTAGAPAARDVDATLRQFHLDPAWTSVVTEWMAAVAATPLDASGARLADVPRTQRRDELEFYFPMEGLDVADLGRRLSDAGFAGGAFAEAPARLAPGAVRGFCRGYVDAVVALGGRFYVVDYKSNRLGPTIDDYAAAALAPEMERAHYWLQYLLYVLAVHRWLGRRLEGYDYDAHFGGVRYLFLRGMDPARGAGHGVYADRPSRRVIELLDAAVAGRRA